MFTGPVWPAALLDLILSVADQAIVDPLCGYDPSLYRKTI